MNIVDNKLEVTKPFKTAFYASLGVAATKALIFVTVFASIVGLTLLFMFGAWIAS